MMVKFVFEKIYRISIFEIQKIRFFNSNKKFFNLKYLSKYNEIQFINLIYINILNIYMFNFEFLCFYLEKMRIKYVFSNRCIFIRKKSEN